MKEELLDELEEISEILKDETCWTQGAQARRADGISVDPMSTEAIQFCLIGAAIRTDSESSEPLLKVIRHAHSISFLGIWNDLPDREFGHVKHLLRETQRYIEDQSESDLERIVHNDSELTVP